jgi:signal peptidase I
MDFILISFLTFEAISYLLWINFSRKSQYKYRDYISFFMFLMALAILLRIFQLNLDFGLILFIASCFAGLSWSVGSLTKIEDLRKESKSYFIILVIITCVRSFTYEPYQIPSRSMEPGLQIGDFVLVNKFAYGLKFPGTHVLLSELKGPARNDVAVFLPPHSLCDVKPEEARPDIISLSIKESQSFLNRFLSLQKNRCTEMGIKYVKRVMGVPGDLIEIKGYEVWVNGEKLKHEIVGEDDKGTLIEEVLDSKNHTIRIQGVTEYAQHSWTIPNGRYLAIGDNRDNSLDSRAWGYFSDDFLIGRADFIWLHWPSFTDFPSTKRNGRIK